MYINNGNTSTAINGMASTGKDNLEDVKLFINNTVDVRTIKLILTHLCLMEFLTLINWTTPLHLRFVGK